MHRQLSGISHHVRQSLDVIFCQICNFECCMIRQGILGGNFDIFAASGESTAWILLWKTHSRPNGVRVCLVAQSNFSSTACDPRAWTMVEFWKHNLGRPSQLIAPFENGGDETNYPSPLTFLDDPDVPCWTLCTSRTSRTSGTSWIAWPTTRMASRSITCLLERERESGTWKELT